MAVATGPDDSVVFHGGAKGTVDFDPGPETDNREVGQYGHFVTKLGGDGAPAGTPATAVRPRPQRKRAALPGPDTDFRQWLRARAAPR